MTKEQFEKALQSALAKHSITDGMSDDDILEVAQTLTESMEDDLGDDFTGAFDSESIDDEEEPEEDDSDDFETDEDDE